MTGNRILNRPISRRNLFKQLGIAAAASFVISYPVLIERYWLEINEYHIYLPRLPKSFDGFRIVQVTDIHIGYLNPDWFIKQSIELANRIPRHITVFTGDAVESGAPPEDVQRVWQMLDQLNAPLGVYAILGNHDHWIGIDQTLHWAEKTSIFFQHKGVRFQRDQDSLWLGGLGDLWHEELGYEKCFQHAGQKDCKIALAHNPDTIDADRPLDIDLFISGHTHGGQVNLPYITKKFAPIHNPDYMQGLIQTNTSQMFVSRGIGWSILPIRFNCPPEISVLVLHPQSG